MSQSVPLPSKRSFLVVATMLTLGCGGDDSPESVTPVLSSIAPSTAAAGGPAFSLVLTGRQFASDAVVRWGGASRATQVVSATEVHAEISAFDIAVGGIVDITVQNPGVDGGTSDAVAFTITTLPTPILDGLEPAQVTSGGPDITVTVRGSGFATATIVRWDGADRPTTYVDQNTLTAAISAADVALADTVRITVFSPPPGGGESSASDFVVAPAGVSSLRIISLAANDLLMEPTSGKLFASVGGFGGDRANSLTPIDPVTGTMGTSVAIGSEPTRMARSDNGQYLYVALRGAAAIRRYNIGSSTAELQFAVGNDPFGGALYAEDIAVLPGAPQTVAVSTMFPNSSPRHAGVRIYDDGVARATATAGHTGSNEIEAASATTLYGANTETTEFGIRTMLVAAAGVTVTQTYGRLAPGFGGEYVLVGGRLYTPGGTVIDPTVGQLVGTYQGGRGPLAVDLPNDRVFFLQSDGIAVYRASTYGFLGRIAVTTGGDHLVRWGTNGLAFAAAESIYLITTSYLPGP
jgi:hypothetical protein